VTSKTTHVTINTLHFIYLYGMVLHGNSSHSNAFKMEYETENMKVTFK